MSGSRGRDGMKKGGVGEVGMGRHQSDAVKKSSPVDHSWHLRDVLEKYVDADVNRPHFPEMWSPQMIK